MQDFYSFHFLETISNQLKARLDLLNETRLDAASLTALRAYQVEKASSQGVYLLQYHGVPAYLGKATDVGERLAQHLEKLTGRRGIDIPAVAYKALLLDLSMSTAANEDVLINLFKQSHAGMWNGKGFGPKDPGKERDTTKPSWFDEHYPIIEDYPVAGLPDSVTLKQLVETMKEKLPYVFRYKVPKPELSRPINLRGVQRRADHLLQKAVVSLGAGWRGTIISYGMLLYKSNKQYPHGRVITSRSPRLP